jgi:DNA replication protein DnaC
MTQISESPRGAEAALPATQLAATANAARAWLASSGLRSLAVTGPVGIGKSRALAALAADLAELTDVEVIETSVATPEAARHLAHRVAH